MKPITPVVPGFDLPITTYGAGQPDYIALPAYRCEGDDCMVVTRWQLTWKERLLLAIGGSLWLSVLTFGKPLQPIKLSAQCPIMGHTGYDKEI